jgi:hypothetical protein
VLMVREHELELYSVTVLHATHVSSLRFDVGFVWPENRTPPGPHSKQAALIFTIILAQQGEAPEIICMHAREHIVHRYMSGCSEGPS